MEVKEYLPIGSVVQLKDGTKKLMIFGIIQSDQGDDDSQEYDYISVPYPEGNMGQDYQFLFNHEDIETVVTRGYEDYERSDLVSKLEEYFAKE